MMRLKRSSSDIAAMAGRALLALVLFFLFVLPLLLLVLRGSGEADVSLSRFLKPFLNSLRLAGGVMVCSGVLGTVFAYLRVKSDLPGRKFIDLFCFISFAIPPYIIALAWVQILGRNGYLDRFLSLFTDTAGGVLNPYSITGCIFTLTLHLYPFVYFAVRNGLRSLDRDLESAGRVHGASGCALFFSITLPMIAPSLLVALIFVFSRALANFGVPALLLLPVRVKVVPTIIYGSLTSLKSAAAARYAAVLMVLSSLLYLLQLKLAERKVVQTSDILGSEQPSVFLHSARYPAAVLCTLFFLITTVMPATLMVVSSFLKRWGLPLESGNFTLNNYREIFRFGGATLRAFANSILFGFIASAAAAVIAFFAAVNSHYRGVRAYEIVASWPMAVPNIVLAVAAVFFWNSCPLPLYGTRWPLILCYMVLFTPIVLNQIKGVLKTQDIQLLHAARIAGCPAWKAFFLIVFPYLGDALRSAFLITILIALREIPIALMLYESGSETVGVLLFGMQSQSYGLEMTSALSVIVVLIILAGNRAARRRFK